MTDSLLERAPTGWTLRLEGAAVTQIVIDFAVTIRFAGSNGSCSVKVGTAMTLDDGEATRVIEAEDAPAAAAVLSLLHATVQSAHSTDLGRLQIETAARQRLTVEPHDHYEAWELYADTGERLVCLPGGSLAMWGKNAGRQEAPR